MTKDNKQIEIATQLETNKLVLKLQTMVLVFLKKIRVHFDRFIELINPAQESQGGNGLGLSIAER